MNNLTRKFNTAYVPTQGLLLYKKVGRDNDQFIQAFDVDTHTGQPINLHPLTEQEQGRLAKILRVKGEVRKKDFLRIEGLIPENLLIVNANEGLAIWYTSPQRRTVYFVDSLTIDNGEASIPALVWVACKAGLRLYALLEDKRPTSTTPLYFAPFFNSSSTGSVCMGTEKVVFEPDCSLNEFIKRWEQHFYGSYFSHLFGEHQPVQANIIQLWQQLVNTENPFPLDALKVSPHTLEKIVSNGI